MCKCEVCTSTLNKYGAPVNNIWQPRQVFTLEVGGYPSLLCSLCKYASDFLPAILCHPGRTVYPLSREFRSSTDESQLGWRRHCRTGDSSWDRTCSGCFPHGTNSPLAKGLHTIQNRDIWMGGGSGAAYLILVTNAANGVCGNFFQVRGIFWQLMRKVSTKGPQV